VAGGFGREEEGGGSDILHRTTLRGGTHYESTL
jgi:hypothetical protein